MIIDAALWVLIVKNAPNISDVMRQLFCSSNEKRDVAIKLFSFAFKHGISIELFMPKLLEIMPALSFELFRYAVYAVRETSFNKYQTFLPFLELSDKRIKQTITWALKETSDKDTEDFINRILPFFGDNDMEMVRDAILSLMEIKDDRIPQLVDKAYRRFPELETLRKNYYRRTWGRTDIG
jgi:hypothetical protein